MRINIKATGIELTPAITSYAEKKIASIEKYFASSPDAVVRVEVGKISRHHKSGPVFRAEAHVIGAGLDLYAVSEQPDLYSAIDLVKDDLAHKLTHEKGKRWARSKRGAKAIKDMIKGLNPFRKRNSEDF